ASWGLAFASMASNAATAYLAFMFLKTAIAPHHSPTAPNAPEPPSQTGSGGDTPGGIDFENNLSYAEMLYQLGQSQGGSQNSMQPLEDYLYQHPELRGHSPSGGFKHGTHGQLVDFGAMSLVPLHGKEQIVTEA